MENFTKDLTIIDFLGILLPGCALLLVLGGDLGTRAFREEYLAFMGGFSCSALFLVCGYVLGSLIHEACDWAEKLYWKLPLFDPKAYAADKVGSGRIAELFRSEVPGQKEPSFGSAKTLLWIAFLSLPLFWAGGLVFPQNWRLRQPSGITVFFLSIFSVFGFFVIYSLVRFPYKRLGDINCVRGADPLIQTRIASRMNFPKRTLFNGFHVMMRNLLFVVLLTLGWHNGRPLDCYAKLLDLDDPWTGLVIAVVVFLMAVRSFHYAYLRYKYSYEDLLELSKELPPES